MEQLIIIVALIFSIVLHEVSHGYVANWLGDPTARLSGRLSGNPLVHLDPLGSVIIPGLLFLGGTGFLFGWAKPVPYNPYNLRHQKWGDALVAASGPAVNILLALIFAALIHSSDVFGLPGPFVKIASYIVYLNILLAFFNLIPMPPLDGSKILVALLPPKLAYSYQGFIRSMERFGLIATFIFIFIFITLFWAPFSQLIGVIFTLFTGLPSLPSLPFF